MCGSHSPLLFFAVMGIADRVLGDGMRNGTRYTHHGLHVVGYRGIYIGGAVIVVVGGGAGVVVVVVWSRYESWHTMGRPHHPSLIGQSEQCKHCETMG